MEGFADIDGPVRVLFPLWVVVAGCVAVLAAALAWLLVRRRRGAAAAQPAQQLRSPVEIALERLGILGDGAGLGAEAFVVEVSDIVRDYVEAALRIPAREQTSEEFLQELQGRESLPEVLRRHMPAFLEQCDLVKFARQQLGSSQRAALLESAVTVVRETDSTIAGAQGAAPGRKEAPAP